MDSLMRENIGFQRSVACLAHPYSLLALVLLLLNDYLFRVYWPSWWTGKLGDFAWLFIFPFALAAVLAWLLPRRIFSHENWAAALAFGLTGMIFTLAKIWPGFHTCIISLASWLFGWPVNWWLDPTDLIALISLGGAAFLWQASSSWNLMGRKPAWYLLPLVACLTIANSADVPSAGVYCLEVIDEQLVAITDGGTYISRSGGLSWYPWNISEQGWIPCKTHFYENEGISTISLAEPVELTDPANPGVVYRITTGKAIERSDDGGQTWITEFQPQLPSQPVQAYLSKNQPGGARFKKTPMDAAFDSQSGNLIFAMGFDGVLVRQTDGTYRPVGVGDFQPVSPGIPQLILTLFPGEILMAVILGGFGVLILALDVQTSLLPRFVAGGAGLLWLIVALWIPPAIEGFGYPQVFMMLALGASGLALLPLVIQTFIAAGLSSRTSFNRYVMVFLGSVLLFFIPFILWAMKILPYYRLAQLAGILLGCGWIFEQYRRQKQNQRTSFGEKIGLGFGWSTALSVLLALVAGALLIWLPTLIWPGLLLLVVSLILIFLPLFKRQNQD